MKREITEESLELRVCMPVGDWIILEPLSIANESSLVLPDNRNAERAAGRGMLEAMSVGSECKMVKKGDYVITKIGTTTLMSFKIGEKEYLQVSEKDVSAVVR